MKLLITGATGFIGQHLLEDIKSANYDVAIITRYPRKSKKIPTDYAVRIADLTDYSSLEKALENIDVLINIAAEVRNHEQLAKTNVLGTENLVKAAIANKVKKIIHLSSVGVVGMQYSNREMVVDENTPCSPKNEYEKTKYQSEQLLIKGCADNNIDLVILRPTNVFGEKHPLNALLRPMQHIQKNKTIAISQHAKVNYVYVKDLTAAIIMLIENKTSLILNIGYGLKYSNFIGLLSKILNKKSKILIIPTIIFKLLNLIGINKLNVLSNQVVYSDKALTSFFKYPHGLEKGLENTYHYFKQKGALK